MSRPLSDLLSLVAAALSGLLMVGLVAMLALPLLLVTVVLALVARRPLREAVGRMRREVHGGRVIEGEWTVLGIGGREGSRS